MVNFNGDLLPADSHFLNHQNRGLLFGDAITEHLRFAGSNIIFWEQYYFRLMASMRQLRMEIPMNFSELGDRLQLIASIGVIIGLVLVIYELRETNRIAENQAAIDMNSL